MNHWDSPTYMISVEDSSLRGGGNGLKQAIWDAAKDTMQEWTGEELTQCSLYGIRVYTEGAVLATRKFLVSIRVHEEEIRIIDLPRLLGR